ncbi:MAG TPA: cell division protein FtsA, partial [Dehalococcoidia bacterium]|nr:cell division protein FtsA [Dehalococcoidia bacterium]
MLRDQVIAAIDVGTTKVCTVLGQLGASGRVEVVGVGIAPSRGLRKGVVVNIEEAVDAIAESIERAERSSGYEIASAIVGIAGSHVESMNNHGVVAVAGADRMITVDDVNRAMESARTVNVPSNRDLLHVIARSYRVDEQEGVRNPIGMHGFRLEVQAHIVTAAATSVQNLTRCIERLDVEVDDLVLEPIASAEAVLTDEEKEMGVVLADIGGGTTDVAIFVDGSIWHSCVLPVGGYHLTNDLAIGLRAPFAIAEQLKVGSGHALPLGIDPDEMVEIAGFGGEARRTVSRQAIASIIEARVEEILGMISLEIQRCGQEGLLPAGLVLTGGTARLKGIEVLASELIGLPVRVGLPVGLTGLLDSINSPDYATSLGLLLWGLRHGELTEPMTPA